MTMITLNEADEGKNELTHWNWGGSGSDVDQMVTQCMIDGAAIFIDKMADASCFFSLAGEPSIAVWPVGDLGPFLDIDLQSVFDEGLRFIKDTPLPDGEAFVAWLRRMADAYEAALSQPK